MSAVGAVTSIEPQAASVYGREMDAWAHAPFDAPAAAEVRALVARLDASQRSWLCGFLAGTLERARSDASQPATPAPIVILYGSQSGNAEQLALRLAARLAERRVAITLDRRAFSYWKRGWTRARGCYGIAVGSHSRDLPLRARIGIAGRKRCS